MANAGVRKPGYEVISFARVVTEAQSSSAWLLSTLLMAVDYKAIALIHDRMVCCGI